MTEVVSYALPITRQHVIWLKEARRRANFQEALADEVSAIKDYNITHFDGELLREDYPKDVRKRHLVSLTGVNIIGQDSWYCHRWQTDQPYINLPSVFL